MLCVYYLLEELKGLCVDGIADRSVGGKGFLGNTAPGGDGHRDVQAFASDNNHGEPRTWLALRSTGMLVTGVLGEERKMNWDVALWY